MKYSILSLVMLFSTIFVIQAQTNSISTDRNGALAVVDTETKKAPKTIVNEAVTRVATYPGGMEALGAYLQKNLAYPLEARENAIEGKVYVVFEVTAQGTIQAASVLSGIGYGCDEEALRVVETMPNWLPALQYGHATTTKVVLPITFSLTE